MAGRTEIQHHLPMSDTDPFIEGLRVIFEANPELKPSVVSEQAGLDNSTIRKLLNGQNASPKVATAEKIANVLGYSLSTVIALGSNEHSRKVLEIVHLAEHLPELKQSELYYFLRFLTYEKQQSALDAGEDPDFSMPLDTETPKRA